MKRVLYDLKSGKVVQFQDTEKFNYADPDLEYFGLIQFDWSNIDTSQTWYVSNGSLTQTDPHPPTFKDLQNQKIARLNAYASQYLAKSDYVVVKKAEGTSLSTNDNNLLLDRQKFRSWLTSVKTEILSATTEAQLNSIPEVYNG